MHSVRQRLSAFLQAGAVLLGLAVVPLAQAAVTRIEIKSVESPTFQGRTFGDVGAYEKVIGIAYGEVDPADPLNAGIVNIQLAPKNSRGFVEYSADVYILRPVDPRRGNRTIFYEVNNRGSKLTFSSPNHFMVGAASGNNPTSASDAADGFLMEQGYTIVWSGWLGNLLEGSDRVIARLPVAKDPSGKPIVQTITTDFALTAPTFTLPIPEAGSIPYFPADGAMASARLYRRATVHSPRQLIPRGEWEFASCPNGTTQTPSPTDLCLPAGFSTDAFYELTYDARDPIVLGLGFAAMRDVVSYLRHDTSPTNPLARRGIRHAIAYGSSQSGRAIRDLVYLGFNQAESGDLVFDGVMPHVGGSRKTWVNFPFGLPGKFSQAVENHYARGDQFPFAYIPTTDPFSGRVDSILAKCQASNTCPKVMQLDSGSEPWAGRFSLVVTDPLGQSDLTLPPNVRVYMHASAPHLPALTSARVAYCQQPTNTLRFRETQRALLVAMQDWLTRDREPPASEYPTLANATLVSPAPASIQFPAIPGLTYNGRYNDLFVNSATEPPEHIAAFEYKVLVPSVDQDGNDVAGVRAAGLRAPLGTHLAYNLRTPGFMGGEPCGVAGLSGSYVPFAVTRAQRLASGDPRPSLQERYRTHAGYVAEVARAARELLRQRLLLAQDARFLIEEAQAKDIGLR
jgi:hypothetical protein